ncbi:MAG: hypothetical protein BroJett013_26060 [Alphaproteobacteria bacterium]|nr:MAG: hypothetical protein BroJett013_26060 [Alphaproteobacteria bacterium]
MKFVLQLLAALWRALTAWLDPPYRTITKDGQLPARLKPRTLYIVQEDGFEEQAAMLCPCGCKRILHMNLLTDERPCWKVTRHGDGTATLNPSVWRKKDCGSHFWFRKGRVQWCRPAPETDVRAQRIFRT